MTPQSDFRPVRMVHHMFGTKIAQSEAEYLVSLREGWVDPEKAQAPAAPPAPSATSIY
jgi:hypothetical protein